MKQVSPKAEFLEILSAHFANGNWIKCSLGHYQGSIPDLKQIHLRPVIIKKEARISFTYRYKTRDIVKNADANEALQLLTNFMDEGFQIVTLFTAASDFQLEVKHDTKAKFRKLPPSQKQGDKQHHDRQKQRLIDTQTAHYLTDLAITNAQGEVLKSAMDKFRQINHYIELLRPMLTQLNREKSLKVADMGSGKGYLTFALYDYLSTSLQLPVHIDGVEFRQDMVDLCNNIARKHQFHQLQFIQSGIENYSCEGVDVLIALHACDTATDDAIAKGIEAGAALIVVAPCCHKQIRKEMQKHDASHDMDFLLKHGIYQERQAEMITDAIRALILEYHGYQTKVFEFISLEHTPKNVMIVAENRGVVDAAKQKNVLKQIHNAKQFFGIGKHYLESCLPMRLLD